MLLIAETLILRRNCVMQMHKVVQKSLIPALPVK
jgi:hypothetical protein